MDSDILKDCCDACTDCDNCTIEVDDRRFSAEGPAGPQNYGEVYYDATCGRSGELCPKRGEPCPFGKE